MIMELILFLVIGIVLGGIIAYFILKINFLKKYISQEKYTEIQKTLDKTLLENAGKISKEELKNDYTSKALFTNVETQLHTAFDQIKEKEAEINYLQDTVVQLTKEAEQKISKEELETKYVSKQSFDIIAKKLEKTDIEINEKEESILTLNKQLTSFQEQEKNLQEKLDLFKKELADLHNLSKEEFQNLATAVLEEKKKIFVDENKKELNTLLTPFKENLKEFKEKVEATRKEDIQDITSLKKEIESLHKLNNQLSDDAKNLASALKSEVKVQGNWGEDRLNMILEIEGLQKYVDYTREDVFKDEEQDKIKRTDFILKLPNNKSIIIDSKVSLTAYANYFNAGTADEKSKYLKQHLKSITDHVENLADKNYQSLASLQTPDYVFMFMPIESALTLALNQNPEIFNTALKRKIILATPSTLVSTLKVVKIIWQKENQVKNVEEIFRQCGELYNKFVAFIEDMEKVETALLQASKVQRDAMNKLKDGTKKGNTIIGRFETIKKLEAKTNKEIPDKYLREIELLPDDDIIETE